MLTILTGNGKGKTTSALGQALRVIGDGGRAVMYQFIKGPWISGEDILISNIKNQISKIKKIKEVNLFEGLEGFYDFDIVKGGKGFVGILGDTYPRSVHIETADKTWAMAQQAIESKKYDLIILDELNVALKLRLLKLRPVCGFLKKNKARVNIMVTGRDAHPRLVKLADLVSEIKDVKHPFEKGVGARKGIEY